MLVDLEARRADHLAHHRHDVGHDGDAIAEDLGAERLGDHAIGQRDARPAHHGGASVVTRPTGAPAASRQYTVSLLLRPAAEAIAERAEIAKRWLVTGHGSQVKGIYG